VRHAQVGVLHDHEPRVVHRVPEPAQGKQLGDHVVLAVAAAGEKFPGNRPVVLDTVVLEIQHVLARVGEAVHRLQLLVKRQLPRLFKEAVPFREVAAVEGPLPAVAVRHVIPEVAFEHAEPLREVAEPFLGHLPVAEKFTGKRPRNRGY
jgi:hypothetical protein